MSDDTELWRLTAAEAAARIRTGQLAAEELVMACLQRIEEIEPKVQAWTYLDPEHALAQARAADEWRRAGRPIGPLHGVPVGLKDIIDTADMPTENGSVLHAGRIPSRDAAVTERLRAAGAVVMGKTVTTEFATRTPGKTRNPHAPDHTPGGSSSGSAAAVAAGMVPLALRFRRAVPAILVFVGCYFILVAGPIWVGHSLPARYIMPVIPLVAAPLLFAIVVSRPARWLFVPLLGLSLVLTVVGVRHHTLLYPDGSGSAALPVANRLQEVWPDFGAADFDAAIQEFGARERRYGGVTTKVS